MKNKTCSSHKKSKLIVIALVLTLPLILTGCTLADVPFIGQFFGASNGGPSQAKLGSANLTVWGLWENPDVINKVINKFNETYPEVVINYDDRSVLKPLVEYKERVFARATDETGPDVMRVHVSWLPKLVGSLTPMPSSMMSTGDFSTKFYPSATANLIKDDKIYGVPSYYDGLVLVYNKDHFEEVGQTEAPTAWEEFRRLALQLTIRGGDQGKDIIRGGAAIGTSNNVDFFSDILGLLFTQARIGVPEGIDTKSAQDALTFYLNFVIEDKVWSEQMPEASVAFSQGKASMIIVPTWNLLDIITAHPEMNIGVAPVPQAQADSPAGWATYWVDVVPRSSKNADAAWALINFMSEREQQLLTYNEATKYRVYGSAYSLVDLAGELSANTYLKPALDTANVASTNILAGRAGNRRETEALQAAVKSVLDASTRGSFGEEEMEKAVQEALINFKAELLK